MCHGSWLIGRHSPRRPDLTRAAAAAILAVAAAAATPTFGAQAASELKAKFQRRTRDIAAGVDGVVGYDILDLTSAGHFSHLAGEAFPTASTIKLAIVYELFKQV